MEIFRKLIFDRCIPLTISLLCCVCCFSSPAVPASAGTLWAWGSNSNGQLGDGTKTDRLTPVKVRISNDIVAVSSGGGFSIALKADGTVWGWGRFDMGHWMRDIFYGFNPVEVERDTIFRKATALFRTQNWKK